MNYYIQGDAAKAEQIRAAFEKLGYDISWPGGCANPDVINIGVERNGAKYVVAETSEYIKDIIKTHPDYQELEPLHKFKEGDLLVHNSSNTRFISVVYVSEKYGYQVQDGGSRHHLSFNVVENEYHLWSIQDANDGDVLMTTKTRNCPFIYRKTDYNNDLAYYYAGVDGNGDFCEGCLKRTLYHFGEVENVVPATKKQRDLLFKKMKEAGYEWDADKKELRKIQPHYDIANFHAGMPVLVRDNNKEWRYVPFSHITNGQWVFNAVGTVWE